MSIFRTYYEREGRSIASSADKDREPVGLRSRLIEFIDIFITWSVKNIHYNQHHTTNKNPKSDSLLGQFHLFTIPY